MDVLDWEGLDASGKWKALHIYVTSNPRGHPCAIF